jgi:hypothetical protein
VPRRELGYPFNKNHLIGLLAVFLSKHLISSTIGLKNFLKWFGWAYLSKISGNRGEAEAISSGNRQLLNKAAAGYAVCLVPTLPFFK